MREPTSATDTLTPAERRSLLLAAVVLESGWDAVPPGDPRAAADEVRAAHTIARSLAGALADRQATREAAARLRSAAAVM